MNCYLPIQMPYFNTDFEQVNVLGDDATFWTEFGKALQDNYTDLEDIDIKSSQNFLRVFARSDWYKTHKDERICIIIDEFDLLHSANEAIRDGFLNALRTIRQNIDTYAIDSIIVGGTFSMQHLTATNHFISPFNASGTFSNPYFTLEDTQRLFMEYKNDEGITIDDDIVQDIFFKSNGYVLHTSTLLVSIFKAGMVFIMTPPI